MKFFLYQFLYATVYYYTITKFEKASSVGHIGVWAACSISWIKMRSCSSWDNFVHLLFVVCIHKVSSVVSLFLFCAILYSTFDTVWHENQTIRLHIHINFGTGKIVFAVEINDKQKQYTAILLNEEKISDCEAVWRATKRWKFAYLSTFLEILLLSFATCTRFLSRLLARSTKSSFAHSVWTLL